VLLTYDTGQSTRGRLADLKIFSSIMAKGWITAKSTVGQDDGGAEIVSTGCGPATFLLLRFLGQHKLAARTGRHGGPAGRPSGVTC
jgi:hypothetical protein